MTTLDKAIADLLRAGAMLSPAVDAVPVLTTIIRPVGRDRWFWWAAGGETEFDGHEILADEAKVVNGGDAVIFRRGGAFVAYLTSIEEAVDEQAVERVRGVLAAWRSRYDKDESLRGFIEREFIRAQS